MPFLSPKTDLHYRPAFTFPAARPTLIFPLPSHVIYKTHLFQHLSSSKPVKHALTSEIGSIQVPEEHQACVYDKVEETETAEPGHGEVLVNLYALLNQPLAFPGFIVRA